MYKGQAPHPIFSRVFRALILSSLCLLWMMGCSAKTPQQNPDQSPTAESTQTIQPSPAHTATESTPQVNPLTTPTSDCLSEGGLILDENFFSDLLQDDFFYKIYLPPCYQAEPELEYPVLYLLHGLTYDSQQWLRIGLKERMDELIKTENVSAFIVVLPSEGRFDPPELSIYDEVLVSELLPHVEKNFRTLGYRSSRAIGGLSRGAAWAVRIGFENHELFGKVGAHSLPLFKADFSRLQTWLTQIPQENFPAFLLDIGRDDPEWESAQSFAEQLDQNGIPHEWYLFNKGHSETYWAEHISQYLLWYGKDWYGK